MSFPISYRVAHLIWAVAPPRTVGHPLPNNSKRKNNIVWPRLLSPTTSLFFDYHRFMENLRSIWPWEFLKVVPFSDVPRNQSWVVSIEWAQPHCSTSVSRIVIYDAHNSFSFFMLRVSLRVRVKICEIKFNLCGLQFVPTKRLLIWLYVYYRLPVFLGLLSSTTDTDALIFVITLATGQISEFHQILDFVWFKGCQFT